MQTVSCPSCGAPVQFHSHAAVMAVCEFCRAGVLKDVDSVKDIGKLSAVLEDFSPIQIGTAGVAGGRNFTVIGRLQLRYAHGMWNEWFVLYDDGASAWLGDSSGQYTLTSERPSEGELPEFDEIEPGRRYAIGKERYTASDVRNAECIGGQGELPFKVGDGWRIRVADLRNGAAFVTLDYTDGELPIVYAGTAVTLEQLKCQLLRDDEQIKASAGKYRGKLDALDCPSCGSMIKYLPGVTTSLVCPACAARLDAAGPEAQVLAAGEKVERVNTTIPVGARAKIDSNDYTVIGVMVRADEEGSEWTEYLLYNTRASFFWLVESEDGWYRASVMAIWPEWHSTGAEVARLDNVDYDKLYEYQARVQFAAGAFNWRVAAGDTVRVYEFEHDETTLAAELSADELSWSRSAPVPFETIRLWFGAALRGAAPAAASGKSTAKTPVLFIWWLLGLNAIPLIANFGDTFFYLILAILAIYLPANFFSDAAKDKE